MNIRNSIESGAQKIFRYGVPLITAAAVIGIETAPVVSGQSNLLYSVEAAGANNGSLSAVVQRGSERFLASLALDRNEQPTLVIDTKTNQTTETIEVCPSDGKSIAFSQVDRVKQTANISWTNDSGKHIMGSFEEGQGIKSLILRFSEDCTKLFVSEIGSDYVYRLSTVFDTDRQLKFQINSELKGILKTNPILLSDGSYEGYGLPTDMVGTSQIAKYRLLPGLQTGDRQLIAAFSTDPYRIIDPMRAIDKLSIVDSVMAYYLVERANGTTARMDTLLRNNFLTEVSSLIIPDEKFFPELTSNNQMHFKHIAFEDNPSKAVAEGWVEGNQSKFLVVDLEDAQQSIITNPTNGFDFSQAIALFGDNNTKWLVAAFPDGIRRYCVSGCSSLDQQWQLMPLKNREYDYFVPLLNRAG